MWESDPLSISIIVTSTEQIYLIFIFYGLALANPLFTLYSLAKSAAPSSCFSLHPMDY